MNQMPGPNSMSVVARSAPLLAPFRTPLAAGDFAPDFEGLDQRGRPVRLFDDANAGRPMVLVFTDRFDRTDVREAIGRWAAAETDLRARGGNLLVVAAHTDSAAIRQTVRDTGLEAPVLGDCNGALFARFGLVRGQDLQTPDTARIFIITAHGQVHSIMTETTSSTGAAGAVLDQLAADADSQARAGWIPGHAPILVIPHALDAADCQELIERYESTDGFRVARPAPGEGGDYKFAVADYNRQDRIDHVIQDRELLTRLDRRISERVIPQVAKAFAFQVTRRETLHIARYRGAREGIAIGHRDNTQPATQYRRFALSISLNDDYEGGELVFREYAGRGYRGDVGTAFVFSSSLLHEIEETTKGTRYNLISHFFNDATVQQPPPR
jgi:peroxiredoxin/predicted 2-oxoglutarate/Fe(II)-dependent dioxygenase YbiX